MLYLSITQHNVLASLDPKLSYQPVTPGWRMVRYSSPASHWLQGMSADQLESRLQLFFIVLSFEGHKRLATKAEFKAEFDRILESKLDKDRQALGVLVNPLMGFNPRDRPVFCRILAVQAQLYQQMLQRAISAVFDQRTRSLAARYISNASNNGRLSDDSIDDYLRSVWVQSRERLGQIGMIYEDC